MCKTNLEYEYVYTYICLKEGRFHWKTNIVSCSGGRDNRVVPRCTYPSMGKECTGVRYVDNKKRVFISYLLFLQ